MGYRPGRHRRPLYDQIIGEHRDMRDRLRALNQAAHDGHDPAEVERVRRALWAVHTAAEGRDRTVEIPRVTSP